MSLKLRISVSDGIEENISNPQMEVNLDGSNETGSIPRCHHWATH